LAQAPEQDLTQVSLEKLINMEVTLGARKEQKLAHTAAAIYVITQEDIRRSGAVGTRGHYRIFAKYNTHGSLNYSSGEDGQDDGNTEASRNP